MLMNLLPREWALSACLLWEVELPAHQQISCLRASCKLLDYISQPSLLRVPRDSALTNGMWERVKSPSSGAQLLRFMRL